MSKIVKRLIFILISLIVIGLMSMILTKNEVKSYNIGNTIVLNARTLGNEYKDVYCVEHTQSIYYGTNGITYQIKKSIEITEDNELKINNHVINNNNKIQAYNKLFAILADNSIDNDRSIQSNGYVNLNNVFELNPKNNYIWDLISSNLSSFSDISAVCAEANNGYKGLGSGYNITGKRYTGRLYLLENIDIGTPGGYQNLILVESAEEVEEVEIQLNFKKTDMRDEPLSGAQIKITRSTNVAYINEESEENLTSNNGEFGTITIKPTSNTGNFTIEVEETEAPQNYSLLTKHSKTFIFFHILKVLVIDIFIQICYNTGMICE